MNPEAMDVLLDNIDSLERGQEFAARINEPVVWYKLGKAQLDNGAIVESIESYLKADDSQDYVEVIRKAEDEEQSQHGLFAMYSTWAWWGIRLMI